MAVGFSAWRGGRAFRFLRFVFVLVAFFSCGILFVAVGLFLRPACRSRLFSGSLFWGCPVARFVPSCSPAPFSSAGAPFASSVVRSARFCLAPWSGCALGVSFRPSGRSFSGVVAVVRFSSPAAAARFVASWAPRLGPACRWCCVRSGPPALPACWLVSVPVSPPPAPVGRGLASRALASRFAASCSASVGA